MSEPEYYDPDEAIPRSPGLQEVKPRPTPSPTPPPPVTRKIIIPSTENVSHPSSRKHGKPNWRKTRPSLGDSVLVRSMDPNRPDIAQLAGEQPLNSDSGSEAEDEDEDMDGPPQAAGTAPADDQRTQSAQPNASVLQVTALKALSTDTQPAIPPTKYPPPFHRDSVVEIDGQPRPGLDTASTKHRDSIASTLSNGISNGADPKHPGNGWSDDASSILSKGRQGSLANGFPKESSPATSPNLRPLTIPQSRTYPGQKLPALQPPQSPRHGPASSPHQERRLPSIKHINDLADTVLSEQQETGKVNGLVHRQSISSSNQSPTMVARHLSISSLSPGSAYPLSAASPISAASETTSRDLFLRSGSSHNALFSPRRPSQASDLQSSNDNYQSSDGLSPGTQPTPIENRVHRMSIDNTLSRTLPPPNGPNIHHIPPHGSGGFKCEHPGCNAPPFQTQYLLNSHANVHSQSRPHYCPVADCPRGEGGKGFKRKNEMIRHGLVHASPGYVCPFCPDREHKYPRPDNLQRHVRVHHVDKDKDDSRLREVLAQRPEGGSRGRRRRVSS